MSCISFFVLFILLKSSREMFEWGLCPKLRIDCVLEKMIQSGVLMTLWNIVFSCTPIVILCSLCKGRNRLHTGDGLHPLAPQWYWEDSVSSVLQMEGSRPWTLQACSGDDFLCYISLECHKISVALTSGFCFFFFNSKAKFEFHHGDYENQFLHALGRKDKAGMVMNNPNQSVFLFLDRQHLQVGCVWTLTWARNI